MALLALLSTTAPAANTEPSFAISEATTFRSAAGQITLRLQGSFSFADTVQLGLPLNVIVSQGQLAARFDLAGRVFVSVNGAPEEPASGPGVIKFAPREILLVLPPGFTSGAAAVQVFFVDGNRTVGSNHLSLSL